jgi:hypothetical protein
MVGWLLVLPKGNEREQIADYSGLWIHEWHLVQGLMSLIRTLTSMRRLHWPAIAYRNRIVWHPRAALLFATAKYDIWLRMSVAAVSLAAYPASAALKLVLAGLGKCHPA